MAEKIFKSYGHAVVFWKAIMPVGGRVAGKGVGVHNSGGSSDGKIIRCYIISIGNLKIVQFSTI